MGIWLWPLLWGFQMELVWAAGILQPQRSPAPKARTPKAKEWTPSSSSSASTWGPTPELDKVDSEGSEAALTFLYSGDALRLSQANCSRRFEVRDVGRASSPPLGLRAALRGAAETLTHATNFLNMIFQTNDIRESSVKEDVEWYHALVRSVVEGDPQAYRAVLTFDAHPVSSKPQLMLQATKENNEILLQDLSASAESLRVLSRENEWFNGLRAQQVLALHKRVLSNDLQSLDTPKWNRGDSYVMDGSHVKWSPPFLECQESKFLPSWLVTLSSSFYGLKPDLSPEFKGVMRLDIKLQNVDINQCAGGPGWFTDTHRCDLNSTQCVPQKSRGFILGRYRCLCKPGFYGTRRAPAAGQFGPDESTSQYARQYRAADSGNLLECRPCQEGCVTCVDDTPCLIQEDWSLRAAVLAFQACCMLAVFLSMLVSYHFRKSKRIRASGVILLETILFGSLLLYFPVFILYFKPSIFRCIVLRWVRMLGFAIVYGTITLKLYRVLKVFLSRSAQRMPYMTSGRVLKMLALILLLVLWFLAAWTVGMLENIDKNIPLVIRSQTASGLQFYICDHDRWDYMMVVAEILFLFWGSFLCYATRTVPSAFHEPRYMGLALHNEMVISAAFHVVRFVMVPSLHPDWTLLLFFIHTHVTITMTLALLFIPKFLHAESPLREEIAAEVYEDELDMRRSGSYLNNSITSAWSEHSLDPDDIRDELKKLYTQLEVHKTKKMTANNPHLQKKRSSKRGLGRSIMRRITEIPESVSRQCREDKEAGGGGSRSGSYKRRLLDSSSSSMKVKDGSSKHRGFSLRKSHSTYDHVRDTKEGSPLRHDSVCKEPPLLDSLMRKKLAKKASERSKSDSLDSAPLVYKSASAHNLLADKKPLHPKPSPLQKSLSVITSAQEKARLLTSRAYVEDNREDAGEKEGTGKKGASAPEMQSSGCADGGEAAEEAPEAASQPQTNDVSQGTMSSLLQGSFESADVCHWEREATPPESRAQKHVTYAPIKSISVDSSHLLGRAPAAGKRTPPQPPVRYQSLAHSLERREVAPWDVLEQTQPAPDAPSQDAKDIGALINICPWEVEGLPRKTEKAEQGEENVQLPSTAGNSRLPSVSSFAAEICPWELVEAEAFNPSQRDEPSEPGDAETPNSSLGKPQSLKTPPHKTSIKSLGLAIKAFNRSRKKSSIEEGSQRKKEKEKDTGGKSDKPKLVETSAPSVGETARQEGTARGPEGSRQKTISKQATICPWEEEDTIPLQQNNNTSKVFEICPWEESVEKTDDPQDGSAPAKISSRAERRGSKDTDDTIRRKLERSQWETICPWETIDSDGAPRQVSTDEDKTSHQSKAAPKMDSSNAEACPWETVEFIASVKTERSPVDGTEAPPVKQDKERDPKGDKSITTKAAASSDKTLEKGSSQRESICPWESLDMEDSSAKPDTKTTDLPSGTSKKSDSVESKKAEVCPWETEEAEANVNTTTYLWEGADTPSEKGNTKQGDKLGLSKGDKSITLKAAEGPSKTLDKMSNQRESICPWESTDMEKSAAKPSTKSPDLSKCSSKKLDSVESKKAEVCPWETEEVETGVKTEICPWEVADAPSEKGTLLRKAGAASKEEKSISSKATGPYKKLEKGSSQRESIFPWETRDVEKPSIKPASKSFDLSKVASQKADSADNKKAEVEASIQSEICPWEVAEAPLDIGKLKQDGAAKVDKGVPPKRAGSRETGDVPSKKLEKGSSQRESVCPWESIDIEEPSGKPATKSLGLHKAASKTSQSVESKKAEVCPWENADVQASVKTEICPWEAVDTPSQKRRQDKVGLSEGDQSITMKAAAGPAKTLDKRSSQRESVCPWDSMDVEEESSIKSDRKSFELSELPSKKSSSVESKKAEVCPWESEEVEASVKAEICPWEVSEAPSDKGKLRKNTSGGEETGSGGTGAIPSKQLEKGSSQRESVCPWEDTSPATETGKMLSKKSVSGESKKSDIGLWEELEPKAVETERVKAEICPWDVEGALPIKTEKHAVETASTAVLETPTVQEKKSKSKHIGQAEHKPLHRLGPDTMPPRCLRKGSSMMGDVLPWDVGVAPIVARGLSKGWSSMADICPQEGAATAAEKDGVEISKTSEACPWEGAEVSLVRATPAESKTAEKLKEEAKCLSPAKSDICPWECE
ncbi:probable G-protein coupled receptor 179 [Emydura macquarii macquarii]|uniref:probable G-protein coupled receptor 179 n=1 Tax=Emydura macquarii macquarii TaxID=1129001 RepID=UPI00352AD2F1